MVHAVLGPVMPVALWAWPLAVGLIGAILTIVLLGPITLRELWSFRKSQHILREKYGASRHWLSALIGQVKNNGRV
jgi:hypothetical protein